MQSVINNFVGPYRFLSNFYPTIVDWEGQEYPSSEHAFNAGKALDPSIREWIASAPTPAEAKRRGRTVVLRPNWDQEVRYEVMRAVLAAKFSRLYLRRLLLSTGEAELVEGNTWHDTHWGCCTCSTHHGSGFNWLGQMLMETRQNLRQYA